MIEHRAVDDTRRLGDAALGTAAIGAGALAAKALSIHIPCPLLAVTGLPCPGCGMTRVADSVLHLDLAATVSADPLGVTVLVVLGVLAIVGVAHRAGAALSLPVGSWHRVRVALLGLLLLRWAGTLTGVVPLLA